MDHHEIVAWLRTTDASRLTELWRTADEARQQYVGDQVHLRGLIELSNHCQRMCGYCGLRAANAGLTRYRMTAEEILACAHQAVAFGYGTVVLQAGEDPGVTTEWMVDVVRRIKAETSLAVTLSLGERADDELAVWREAGADRYLLRLETSNETLYHRYHPRLAGGDRGRVAILRRLSELGYEVGSGVLIGLPGQTYDDVGLDIALFARLELDMIGCGPFLAHPDTPLGGDTDGLLANSGEQVVGDELTTYKVMALSRLVCPRANIPSTTALATLNRRSGRELGLVRGANVVMPNLTPPEYRVHYEIYPNKACLTETAEACSGCLRQRIESLGRRIGVGRGDSPNYRQR